MCIPWGKTISLDKLHSSVSSVCGLENRRSLVQSPARHIFFPRIDDSHCNRNHSSLTAVFCFDNGYVRKQLVAWKQYCAEYWLKEFQESMGRCTGRHDIYEIMLKKALNTIQSINQSTNSLIRLVNTSRCLYKGSKSPTSRCLYNSFPSKPWFLRVCSTCLLKTLWEKEKLLVTSNSSFSQCFLPVQRTFCQLHQI